MSKRDDAKRDTEARARSEADVAFVEALARLLRENDLADLEVTREYGGGEELHVRLSRAGAVAAPVLAQTAVPVAPPPPALAAPAPALEAPAASAADPADHPGCVTSPMVGTVYLSPDPGSPPFVDVGVSVETGQTLLIVEAMKTMNQIPSPRSGVVKRILVDNQHPVEFGTPLVIIE